MRPPGAVPLEDFLNTPLVTVYELLRFLLNRPKSAEANDLVWIPLLNTLCVWFSFLTIRTRLSDHLFKKILPGQWLYYVG